MGGTLCLVLDGLNCANCANKIEKRVAKLPGVTDASLNFTKQEILVTYENEEQIKLIAEIKKIVSALEPGVKVMEKSTPRKPANTGLELDKGMLLRFAAGVVCYAAALAAGLPNFISLLLFVAAYIIFGGTVVMQAAKNILRGDFFDENFLMSLATLGAFAIGEYPEAVAVMLFYQIGEMFQDAAVRRSRGSIEELMNIKPEFANLLTDGTTKSVSPDKISVGSTIIIRPGEKIPLDGVVIEGRSQVDASALIGESVPQSVSEGEAVLSGAINLSGLLKVQVTKDYSSSTVAKILELVENAAARKAPTEKFITKFARVYTPIVVFAALALAFIPPIFTAEADLFTWVSRGLVFLVVSCPCALVVSVPLSFFSGIGTASRRGILMKGSNSLQELAEANIVVFDKTGTLTAGVFNVTEVTAAQGVDENDLLTVALTLEQNSAHPIAKAVTQFCRERGVSSAEATGLEEIPGYGLRASLKGSTALAGNLALMENISADEYTGAATVVYIAHGEKYLGRLIISDVVKPDAAVAVSRLKALGISKTVMLTGDRQAVAQSVATSLGITEVSAELLPGGKVDALEKLYSDNSRSKIVFVGDGINDAPILMRANVGIAMGGIGSDAAIEAADVVLMTDEPSKIAEAITISRSTMKIVKQNVTFALGVKGIVLALGALGLANMWLAVFADVGVALLVIINAMRKK